MLKSKTLEAIKSSLHGLTPSCVRSQSGCWPEANKGIVKRFSELTASARQEEEDLCAKKEKKDIKKKPNQFIGNFASKHEVSEPTLPRRSRHMLVSNPRAPQKG